MWCLTGTYALYIISIAVWNSQAIIQELRAKNVHLWDLHIHNSALCDIGKKNYIWKKLHLWDIDMSFQKYSFQPHCYLRVKSINLN